MHNMKTNCVMMMSAHTADVSMVHSWGALVPWIA